MLFGQNIDLNLAQQKQERELETFKVEDIQLDINK